NAAAQGAGAAPAAQPQESVAIPVLEIIGFDLALSNLNRSFSGSHDYDVSWASIRRNLKGPWVTDNDPFRINQFAHPYQGSIYHGIGRSMGLDYWQASALTFAGSAWWEITGEKTPPSKNDQIASGIAGSFFGEPLFRMAHLVADRSTLRDDWRHWVAGAISPPVGVNRWAFGDRRYGARFEDHDPAYYSRLHIGGVRTVRQDIGPDDRARRDAAQVDFSMDYGLPGKQGYSYDRPFDYFNFQAVLSGANGVENLSSNGLLLGDHVSLGAAFRGIAGIYATYEYLAPQIFHVSTTSVSLGTTGQIWLSQDWAVQASALAGVGYAAASTTIRNVNSAEYHYGMAPRGGATLRFIDGDRAAIDVAARMVSLGSIANRGLGRDDISRVETAFTWRLAGRHAIGIDYVRLHRSAAFAGGIDRRQTLGQVGIFYTLLGQQDFGAVEWR
ncbi:MAG: DUF3943 domain-containing protein, partial [Burkholderiaceae bacterium]